MNATPIRIFRVVLIAMKLSGSAAAFAGQEPLAVDAQFLGSSGGTTCLAHPSTAAPNLELPR